MPRISSFAIPAEEPQRAMEFYRNLFGWRFELGWEYDTPNGREGYWHVFTGNGSEPGIDGGITKREYPEQPISVGVEVNGLDEYIQKVEQHGGKIIVPRVPLPGVGWFSLAQDSEGNTFAMYQRDETIKTPNA